MLMRPELCVCVLYQMVDIKVVLTRAVVQVVLTRAAYAQGLIQMCPTLALCAVDEMIAAAQPS